MSDLTTCSHVWLPFDRHCLQGTGQSLVQRGVMGRAARNSMIGIVSTGRPLSKVMAVATQERRSPFSVPFRTYTPRRMSSAQSPRRVSRLAQNAAFTSPIRIPSSMASCRGAIPSTQPPHRKMAARASRAFLDQRTPFRRREPDDFAGRIYLRQSVLHRHRTRALLAYPASQGDQSARR